jgi:hypothetical protein
LACTLSSTSVSVDAECIQASLPAVRSPVSSKCATSAPAIRSVITGITSSVTTSAVLVVQDATVPGATGASNRSPNAAAVRPLDRNWPWNRYTPAPAIRGPYCTGAFTPAGAAALVTVPHEHCRQTMSCWVTSNATVGRSNTCRESTPTTGAPARSPPHPTQACGSCRCRCVGSVTGSNVNPACPFGRPGPRPDFSRNDRGAGLARPSELGGLLEFFDDIPNRA